MAVLVLGQSAFWAGVGRNGDLESNQNELSKNQLYALFTSQNDETVLLRKI